MADRYWVGGTGTWSSTDTTNWSDTSGGSGGFSVPTASDNVFFDAGSDSGGTFVVTIPTLTAQVCNDITISGLDFGMTLTGTIGGLIVSGSLEFPATNFTRTYTGPTTFNATTSGKTITTNGVAFGGNVTFNGVGGEWTLGSALSVGTSTITLTNGTFDTGGYNVTAGFFSSSNTNIRTVNLNASTVTLSNTWSLSTNTNATVNAGTSEIIMTSGSGAFSGGGFTYYNVSSTSTSSGNAVFSFSGNNTFNNLSITAPSSSGEKLVNISSETINGTFTATGASSTRRIFLRAGATGSASTLTCAAIAATSDTDFRDITIAGAASPLSGTRLGDCNGNTNITFDAPKTVYWNLAGGGNWTSNAWALSSGGAVDTANFPLAQDSVIIENTGLNTSATITINNAFNIGPLDISTRSNAMTLSITNIPTFYGNVTYSSAVTPTGTLALTFSNRSIKTFDCAGKTFDNPITIDAPGGGIQLINNNFVTGATRVTNLTRGTLDLNDLDWTTGTFTSSNSNTREIDFGTGEINITGTGSNTWSTATATNLTVSGTPVVNVTSTGATAITVNSGSASEANSISFNFTGGTYALTFFGFSNYRARNVDFTGFAGTWNATSSGGLLYGNLTLSTGMTLTASNNTFTFAGTSGTQLITTNGKTIDFPINFNGAGGTFQLQDAMTLGSTRLVSFTNGTVDLNGYTLTSGTGNTGVGTKNITFNGGTLLLSGSGSSAWVSTSPNFTTTAGTGTGAISMTSASAKTFSGGGFTYNCNLNQGGAGNLTINGANTFNDITNSVQPATILFSPNTTQTVSNFTLSGTPGNLITIDSTLATQFTLSKASGTVSVSYLDIRDSNATGGATWNAFTSNGNVDGGNNTGWVFSGGGTVYDVTVLESITAADLISALAVFPTSIIETSTASEQTSATASLNSNANESATGTDTISGSADFNNQVNESATGSEQTSSLVDFATQIDESATGSDQVLSAVDFVAQIDESATGTDQIVSAVDFASAINEFVTGTDQIISAVDFAAQIDESATGADQIVSSVDFGVAIDESASGSDIYSVVIDFAVQIDESVTGTDQVSSIGTFQHFIDESATGADEVLAGVDFTNQINESATGSDEIVGAVDFGVAIDEAAAGSDQIVGAVDFGSTVNESAAGADQILAQADFVPQISETVTAADEVSSIGSFQHFIQETATGTDQVSAGVVFVVVVLEASAGTDEVSATKTMPGLVQEAGQGQDLIIGAVDFGASVQETATGADSVSTLAIFKGTVSETTTASEAASALATFLSNVSESVSGADGVLAGVDFAALAAEVGIGLDRVLARGTFRHFIKEAASGLDTPRSNTNFNAAIQELGIAADSQLARFLWELINDSQSVTWQNVQSAGATNWAVINVSENTTWQDVPTTT